MDTTYNFHLITLLVLEDYHEGIPVAYKIYWSTLMIETSQALRSQQNLLNNYGH